MLHVIPFEDIVQGQRANLCALYYLPIHQEVDLEQAELPLPLSMLRLNLLLGRLVNCVISKGSHQIRDHSDMEELRESLDDSYYLRVHRVPK